MSKSPLRSSKAFQKLDKPGKRPTRAAKGLTPLTAKMTELGQRSRQRDEPLEPRSDKQALYIATIQANVLTFGIGPAGTGKTFCATSLACEAFVDGKVDRIIITRPVVEAGEELGFLPGEMMEKFAPYLAPVRQILDRRLGRGAVDMFLKDGHIECLPLAFMRGHTFSNAFVILDEAQNTTKTQMKMFLTRIGEGCRVIVDGDPRQIDIAAPSGLIDAVQRLRGMKGVGLVEFTRGDIVRSGLVQDIVEAYEDHDDDGLHRMLNLP